MNKEHPAGHDPAISTRAVEIGVAIVLLAFGALIVWDSHRLGSSWGSDGPQSGYFPFYIGLIICFSALATLAQVLIDDWKAKQKNYQGAVARKKKTFVTWSAFRQVLQVLVPSLLFVLAVQFIGIYVSGVVFITLFMVYLGHYSWVKSMSISLAVMIATFAMFEIWFRVPLWKGDYNPLFWTGY